MLGSIMRAGVLLVSVGLLLAVAPDASGFGATSALGGRVSAWSGGKTATASAATPTPPGSPALWFDASDIDGDGSNNAAYTDGDPIGSWTSKGSQTVAATQATASAKPTYKTGGPNGLDYLRGDGGDNLSATITNIVSLMGAVLLNSGAAMPGNEVFAGYQSNTNLRTTSSPRAECFIGGALANGGTTSVNTWHMLVGRGDGTNALAQLDGNASVVGSAVATKNSGTAMSVLSNTSGAGYATGAVGDVLAYNYDGSVTFADVLSYYQSKYGSLPLAGTP